MSFGLIDLLIANSLWIVSIVLLLGACGTFFFYKSYKADAGVQKQILFGYGLFCFCYGITRIFFFIESIFPRDSFQSNFFTLLGYSIGYVSAIFLFFVLERHLIKTKYIFTIISCVTLIISIVFLVFLAYLPIEIPRYFSYLTLPFLIISIIALYLWIAKRSEGEVRSRALGAAISILLIALGMILDSSAVKDTLAILPLTIAPVMIITGIVLFVFFQRHAGE